MYDRIFDEDSFEGLKSIGEVKQSSIYLSQNEAKLRRELYEEEELSSEEIEKVVQNTWTGLLNSAKKVGYTNNTIEFKKKQYGFK